MPKFTYVSGDDWNAIYKDGKLIIEGRSWSPLDWLEALGVDGEVVTANLNWLGDRGDFPNNLEDVETC